MIAPLLTRGDDLLVQSSFHVLRMFAERRDGTALRVSTEGPTYQTRGSGDVPMIDASAILDGSTLHLFCVNRSTDDARTGRARGAGSNGAALRDGEAARRERPRTR